MCAHESTANITNVQIADPRFNIDGRIVRYADREIHVTDIATACIIFYQVNDDTAAQTLRLDDRCRRFEGGRYIYLRPVPTFDRDRPAAVQKLKTDTLTCRIRF